MTISHQLEKQIAAAGHHGQVADLVDNEQRKGREEANALAQSAFALRLGQRGNEVGQGAEVDAPARLDGLDPERHGQVRFARARWTEQMNGFVPIDEVQLRQREDPVAIERGLEGELEAGQRLPRGDRGRQEAHLPPPFWRSVSSSVSKVSIASS